MAVEEIITKEIVCKDCDSTAFMKFGICKGIQRFYCKACKCKFKEDGDSFPMKVPAK